MSFPTARKRLYVSTKSIEVDKPAGGGHGPSVPYLLHVSIDGKLALTLSASDFKEPGQLAALTEILEEHSAPDITASTP